MKLPANLFEQRLSKARLSDSGFSRQKDHLPVALACEPPVPDQERKFVLPSNQWRSSLGACSFESTNVCALTQNRPGKYGVRKAFQYLRSHILKFKSRPEQTLRRGPHNDGVRIGERLQPSCEIGRLSHH